MDLMKKETMNVDYSGPGGPSCDCPCCGPWPKRYLKMFLKRVARRKLKLELRKENDGDVY